MRSRLRMIALFGALMVLPVIGWSQGSSGDSKVETQKPPKIERTPGKEMGKGGENIGTGAAKGAGSIGKGTAKGVGSLAHGNVSGAGSSFGKGVGGAGKDVGVGTAKGVGKIGKGIGGEFKKL